MIRWKTALGATLLSALSAAQFEPAEVFKGLLPAGPAPRKMRVEGTIDHAAISTFFSPNPNVLALSNGLSTDYLAVTGGQAILTVQIDGKSESIGPGLTRVGHPNDHSNGASNTWRLEKLSLGTSNKWTAAPGCEPWPPRGETATFRYADPATSDLSIEIRVEMMDGYPNDELSAVLINNSNNAVRVDKVSWAPGDPGYVLRQWFDGSDEPEVACNITLPPHSQLNLPRVTGAAVLPHTQTWAQEFTTSIFPWTKRNRIAAWIKAVDGPEATQRVDTAADLGFQRVAVSVVGNDLGGVVGAVVQEAHKRGIEAGLVWDAKPHMPLSSFASTGDGLPCRASRDAEKSIDLAYHMVTDFGFDAFYDATTWSTNCSSTDHGLHEGPADFAWKSADLRIATGRRALATGKAYYAIGNWIASGAVARFDPSRWPLTAPTEPEIAVAVGRSDGLVPLPDPTLNNLPIYKKWLRWGNERSVEISTSQLPVFSESGRALAILRSNPKPGIDLVLCGWKGPREGCKATVSVPFPEGAVLKDAEGHSLTVSTKGTVSVNLGLKPDQVELWRLDLSR